MKMLIDWFEIQGTSSYPDDHKNFKSIEKVNFNEVDYYYTEYTGDLPLESGDTAAYEVYLLSQTGIRILSPRAWFERIPTTARKLIRKSTNEDVLDVMDGLKYTAYVDLDSPITLRDLNILQSAGLLTNSDITEMLKDGEEYEKYNGVL